MARKKRARNEVEEAEVPLSSMIDVVFLLLIYFILTQKPIIEDTLLGVNLPAPGRPPKSKEKPPTMFTIDVFRLRNAEQSPNYYYINNKGPWHIDKLREFLETTAQNDPEQTIIINCGPNAKHRKLVQALDACAQAGLYNLNIVNDEAIAFRPDKYVTTK